MKKAIMLVVLILWLMVNTLCYGANGCSVTNKEQVSVPGGQRYFYTLICTGDGSITPFSFDPDTYGVKGWYLYNITTDPGTSAPTAAYDITLMVDGEDVAGGLLADRSTSATQTVQLSPTTLGYHMVDRIMDVTFADETANPSTIVMTLRFTSN
jgi:hypothetical protein